MILHSFVLIVPSGIETNLYLSTFADFAVLIVPSGIETTMVMDGKHWLTNVLIVPSGIETCGA